MNLQKRQYIRSRKILDSCKDQNCTLQFPGCKNDTETTVPAHINAHWAGKGGSIKADDIPLDACGHCHHIYDFEPHKVEDINFYLFRGLFLTVRRMILDGTLK